MRRLFSFLNFSDRFKKSRPRADDRFVASIPERKMADPLYGRLRPLPSRGGLDAHLVDDGAGALHRRAFADEVEPARNIGIHIGAGTEAFDVGAMRPETDIGDGIEIAREI